MENIPHGISWMVQGAVVACESILYGLAVESFRSAVTRGTIGDTMYPWKPYGKAKLVESMC